ncbi:unnamed protein product [Blepharisma stoltei]|uniref:GPR180/TMEM145 transmembrane domain-containing protein n=1 Tax=Blepharisma stoltei TaxID=1481888 RepID=A0AAU9JIJ4_9CILI|nr:unnamed protein product [Blepharisma stoltei]
MMLIILLFVTASFAKYISNVVTLGAGQQWKYISKFAVDVGAGEWELKAKFNKPINETYKDDISLVASVYIDDNWDEVMDTNDCKTKVDLSRRERFLFLNPNGEWSEQLNGKLSQKLRPHIWYFAISDCEGKLSDKTRIKVEMHFVNEGHSEFSTEDNGLVYLYPILLVLYLIALSGNIFRLIKMFQKTNDIETNVIFFNSSIGCQFGGIFFQCIHLWVYSYNGKGITVFDFFSQSLEIVSTLIITILFILMATGWTLKQKEFPDADVYIPVGLMVVLLNLVIVGLGRITDDSYYKFSDYEGIIGFLLILIRIGLWGWFIYLIRGLMTKVHGKMSQFVTQFAALATIYFLALPALIIISWLFAPYFRNKVVILGSTVIQMGVFVFLTHLFSEKSTYYKISSMSDSVLPGKMR